MSIANAGYFIDKKGKNFWNFRYGYNFWNQAVYTLETQT